MTASLPSTVETIVPELCWRKIGVWGDRSCTRLGELVHCQNCGLYSKAGRQLLHRTIPESYYGESESRSLGEKPAARKNFRTFLIFRIDQEYYGLPAGSLAEVVDRRRVHALPHARSHVLKGLVNIRGELLICISLSRLLSLEPRTHEARCKHTIFERLLVARGDEGRFVVPVSEVDGLHRVAEEDLCPAPATVTRSSAPYTDAVVRWNLASRRAENCGDSVHVSILNAAKLFKAFGEHLR